jgi:type II secretory pathway pseudopilin PulG
MLVVGIVSFISISTLTGFSISSERLKFQNQLSTLESFITSHRAVAFNDSTDNNEYTIILNQESIQANSTDSISGLPNPNSPNILNIPSEDLELLQFEGRSIDSNWNLIPSNQSVTITINPEQRICEITTNNEELIIIHIPIRKPNEIDPSKHLYIHRSNCLIESLNEKIQKT